LFRPLSDSTAHDRRNTQHELGDHPLPDTLRIIKPLTRRPPGTGPSGLADAPAPPTDRGPNDSFIELEGHSASVPDTQGVGNEAAATDDALTMPPELAELPRELGLAPDYPRSSDATTPHTPLVSPAYLPRARTSARAFVGVALAVLALVGGVLALVFAAR
jgi:hypothetical protein